MMHYRSLPCVGLALLTGLVTYAQSRPATAAPVPASQIMAPASIQGRIQAFRVPALENVRLELSLSQRRVTLFRATQALKSYPVAIGKVGWETPTGQFKVKTKMRNPPWRSPFNGSVIAGGHPRNPLGRRWIGFWTNGKDWIGFHGTPNRSSVGSAASHGCVRMFNEDINELFDQITVGTPVIVKR